MEEKIERVAKQVIVVRDDLKMTSGKMSAQVAHASLGCLLDNAIEYRYDSEKLSTYQLRAPFEGSMYEWLQGIFRKIVLKVDSDEALLEIYRKAKSAGLTAVLITDQGHTVFKEPTNTCVGIGPHWSNVIDPITKDLKLMR